MKRALSILTFVVIGLSLGRAGAFAFADDETARLPTLPLGGTDGRSHDLKDEVSRAKVSAIVFFSSRCTCQKAHDDRLKALFEKYRTKGVTFFVVDSDFDAPSRDKAEAPARGYPFPILSDPTGAVADSLGARFATYSVVLDREGHVLYRGGFDSDKNHLSDHPKNFLDDALADLVNGRAPAIRETKPLGCAIKRW